MKNGCREYEEKLSSRSGLWMPYYIYIPIHIKFVQQQINQPKYLESFVPNYIVFCWVFIGPICQPKQTVVSNNITIDYRIPEPPARWGRHTRTHPRRKPPIPHSSTTNRHTPCIPRCTLVSTARPPVWLEQPRLSPNQVVSAAGCATCTSTTAACSSS